MFSVRMNETIQDCSRLEKQISELAGQAVELEYVIRELSSLSNMEEAIARLEHQHSEMDFQYTVLKQMMLALNKSVLNYSSCENQICDNGEQNVVLYTRQEIDINDFSSILNILNGL